VRILATPNLLAVLVATAACGHQAAPSAETKTSLDARSATITKREPVCASEEETLEQGLQLERAGKKAEALEVYRPCLPELLFRVYMLGKCYPPAQIELQAYRDKVEASLQDGLATRTEELSHLASINSLYHEPSRTTQLYRRLIAAHRPPALVSELHTWIWKDLVEQRAYAEALRFEDHLSSGVSIGVHPDLDHWAIKRAATYYEALLGIGRYQDAANGFEQLIQNVHDPEIIRIRHLTEGAYDSEIFSEFLKHACRVNDAAAISDVVTKAAQYIDAEAMDKLRGSCVTPAHQTSFPM
jgi:hypothetical protein